MLNNLTITRSKMKREIVWAIPNSGYSCKKEYYDIVLLDPDVILKNKNKDGFFKHAFIIFYTSSLHSNDSARNILINRICNNELTGVPVSHVHLILMMNASDSGAEEYKAFHYLLHFDCVAAHKKRPDKVEKTKRSTFFNRKKEEYSWFSHNVLCEDFDLFTNSDPDNTLTLESVQLLLNESKK